MPGFSGHLEPGRQSLQAAQGGQAARYHKPPATLDEVLRRLLSRLHGRRSGGPGRPRPHRAMTLVLAVVGLVMLWGAFGVSTVAQGEHGVIIILGRVMATVRPGLHWYPPYPLGRMVIVDTTERRHQFDGSLLTGDGQLVDVSLTVAYRIDNPATFLFATTAPEVFLAKAVQTAVLHVMAGRKLDDILQAPLPELKQQLIDLLQQRRVLAETGLDMQRVVGLRLGVPGEVAAAYDAALKAHATADQQVEEAQSSYVTRVMSQATHKASALLHEARRRRAEQLATAQQRLALFEALLPAYQKEPQALLRWLGAESMRQPATLLGGMGGGDAGDREVDGKASLDAGEGPGRAALPRDASPGPGPVPGIPMPQPSAPLEKRAP